MSPSYTGITSSFWMETSNQIKTEALQKDLEIDVCVIGGGIAGLSTAYNLQKSGREVVLLEASAIGAGETGRTTAHFSFALDERYFELEHLIGKTATRHAAESHMAAVNWVEEVIQKEQLDCEFERIPGYLFLGRESNRLDLEKEFKAAHDAGLVDITLMEKAPLPFNSGPCLCFPNQAQLHPLKYLHGLLRAFIKLDGKVYTDTHVHKIEKGVPARILTSTGAEVLSNYVVVATNTPVHAWLTLNTKQAPYRTYAIGARIPKASVTKALYWDTEEPYHYIRLSSESEDTDLLIIGGEDHKTGQKQNPEECFRNLEIWSRQRFSMIESLPYKWSGQVMEPVDGLAFIGRLPNERNVFIVTGDSGHGMTHGTIAGLLITDLILGRDNPWTYLYDPGRVSFSFDSIKTFIRENLNVAFQYLEWLSPSEGSQIEKLENHSGGVFELKSHKTAVYRDAQGQFHFRSAVCTHLNCIVRWNSVEKSWDCPCHGSRFDPLGKVIHGPAAKDLNLIDVRDIQREKASSS